MTVGTLVDIRAKVSLRAHYALISEERATGKSHSEIVREVLEAWAAQRALAANVLTNLMRVEGIGAAPEGNAAAGEGAHER